MILIPIIRLLNKVLLKSMILFINSLIFLLELRIVNNKVDNKITKMIWKNK